MTTCEHFTACLAMNIIKMHNFPFLFLPPSQTFKSFIYLSNLQYHSRLPRSLEQSGRHGLRVEHLLSVSLTCVRFSTHAGAGGEGKGFGVLGCLIGVKN